VGFGPIAWLLISEVFPLEARGQAIAVAVSNNFFWNLVVTLVFDAMRRNLGTSTTFGLFTVLALVSLVFVFRCVPETRGLSLEQIEGLFVRKR
jgi:MFS transporter, SP family, galactose:H+ symporter